MHAVQRGTMARRGLCIRMHTTRMMDPRADAHAALQHMQRLTPCGISIFRRLAGQQADRRAVQRTLTGCCLFNTYKDAVDSLPVRQMREMLVALRAAQLAVCPRPW